MFVLAIDPAPKNFAYIVCHLESGKVYEWRLVRLQQEKVPLYMSAVSFWKDVSSRYASIGIVVVERPMYISNCFAQRSCFEIFNALATICALFGIQFVSPRPQDIKALFRFGSLYRHDADDVSQAEKYRLNKIQAVSLVEGLLDEPLRALFSSSQKKDDLADAYLALRFFIIKKTGQENVVIRG